MLLENIKRRRKKLDKTQAELAKLSGVSQSMIAKIESGKLSPSFDKAKQIFDTLDQLEHETSAKASEIMSRNITIIESNDIVDNAISKMKQRGISQLPVFEKGHLVGLISESILTDNLDRPNLGKLKVKEIMTEAPPTISEDTPVKLVSELLKYNPTVIVYRQADIKGIITKADLLKTI